MWILFLVGFIFLASLAYASNAGAPWVPTWKKDFERINKLANLQPGETFIELGCGNGRVCRAVAKAVGKASPPMPSPLLRGGITRVTSPLTKGEHEGDVFVIGVELSLLQYLIAQLQVKLSGLKNIQMKLGNAFHQDLSKVDVVYMFFMPETYKKIRGKLDKELKPGARVITYVWPIEGWVPVTIDELEGQPKIYVYQR
jgi:tRNA A58 N-methylase Trm61